MVHPDKLTDVKDPQVKGGIIENPTTGIGTTTVANDAVAMAIRPLEYRQVKGKHKRLSMQLKNAEVAYLGNEIIKIARCVGYYYNNNKDSDDALKKAISDALSGDQSAVIMVDNSLNTYVALLTAEVFYRDIHTADDFSSRYGGLTYLEIRARKHISSLRIKLLITSDKHVLTPFSYPLDYLQGNSYYTRINDNLIHETDEIIHILSQIKSGKLESYIRGHERFAK